MITINDGSPYQNTHLDVLEHEIRSMASSVLVSLRNRAAHPTYGYTKTSIRAQRERMEGAIGIYMVITGQAGHPNATANVAFRNTDVADTVNRARDGVRDL